MTTLTKDQLIEKVLSLELKYCVVYDAMLRNVPEKMAMFAQWETESAGDLVNKIQEFSKIYGGSYTFMCKKKRSGVGIHPFLFAANLQDVNQNSVATIQGAPRESAEDMENRILEKIKGQLLVQKSAAELEATKSELGALKESGNKIAYVLEQVFINRFMPAPPLQGTNGSEAATEGMTDDKEQELGKAYVTLTKILGSETLIKLVAKLEQDPSTIKFVKNYANG